MSGKFLIERKKAKGLKVTLMKQQVMGPPAMEMELWGIWIAYPTLETN